MGIFKSYDIRGLYGDEWNADTAYRIGSALPGLLGAEDIVVGRDARLSSGEISESLVRGITDAGCEVADVGLCSTPALVFAAAAYGYGGSVMVTASHNPAEYNGLKISGRRAVPVGYENGLNELERIVSSEAAGEGEPHDRAGARGAARSLDIRADYLVHLERFNRGIGSTRAVIDCSDGMAGLFIGDVIDRLDGRFTLLFDTPDGRFPHHDPNPLEEKNLEALKRGVLEESADLGICFDGDADRVMFVDERGRFVSPDLITAVLARHYFDHEPERRDGSDVVLYDVRSSRSVVEEVRRLGGEPVMCRVGHAYAKRLLRERNGILGGELAGHYYFKENFFCDSGMIAALLVLSVLSRERGTLSELVASVQRYAYSGEINFQVEDKAGIIESLRRDYTGGELTGIDGIRVDFPSWWFNVRPSNTEPYLRMVVEASSPEELRERTGELTDRIRRAGSSHDTAGGEEMEGHR